MGHVPLTAGGNSWAAIGRTLLRWFCLWIQAAGLHLLNLVYCVAGVLTLCDFRVLNCLALALTWL